MKLTPGVHFNNILRVAFFIRKCYVKLFCNQSLGLYFFGNRKSTEKLLKKCCWHWLQASISPTWALGAAFVFIDSLLFQLLFHQSFLYINCASKRTQFMTFLHQTFVQYVKSQKNSIIICKRKSCFELVEIDPRRRCYKTNVQNKLCNKDGNYEVFESVWDTMLEHLTIWSKVVNTPFTPPMFDYNN